MDMPILLETTKRQMSFLGEIIDNKMQAILFSRYSLVLHATKRVLGEEFLKAFHRYRVNTDMTTMFLTVLLYMGVRKAKANTTLDNMDGNLLISLPQNNYMSIWYGVGVGKIPIVCTLMLETLEER